MTAPMLALGMSDETSWQQCRERCTVTGPWEAFERAAEAAITRGIADMPFLVPFAGELWSTVLGEADALHLAPYTNREAWAKVCITVTVEVLDGLP